MTGDSLLFQDLNEVSQGTLRFGDGSMKKIEGEG